MIYLAPIQGFTDYIFRNAYDQVFEGVDAYFIPYATVQNNAFLPKYEREILPENNLQEKVVPQILVKDEDEADFLLSKLTAFGYSEINLNMGCPYPMVTNKGRGAALLEKPELLAKILDTIHSKYKVKLSVKLRAGMERPDQIQQIIPVLNEFPLSEVILHPRIAKQLYKGSISDLAFKVTSDLLEHQLVYNGDIFTLEDFRQKSIQFSKISDWMLGRGILMNLFLPAEIKGTQTTEFEKRTKLHLFHSLVMEAHLNQADNPGNALNKLKQFWIYFSFHFVNQKKVFKKIKKLKKMSEINALSLHIIQNESLTGV